MSEQILPGEAKVDEKAEEEQQPLGQLGVLAAEDSDVKFDAHVQQRETDALIGDAYRRVEEREALEKFPAVTRQPPPIPSFGRREQEAETEEPLSEEQDLAVRTALRTKAGFQLSPLVFIGQQLFEAREEIGDIAADIGFGLTEIPGAITTGVGAGLQEMLDLVLPLAEWLAGHEAGPGDPAIELPELEFARPETVTGSLVKGVTQFLVGFKAAGKALKFWLPVSKGGKFAKEATKFGLADAFFFDPQERNLFELIKDVPFLRGPVLDYLAGDPEDSDIERRFKRFLEGLGIGGVAEGLFMGVRLIRTARRAKREMTGEEPPTLEGQFREEFGEVGPEDLSALGDLSKPLVVITKEGAKKVKGAKTPSEKLTEALVEVEGVSAEEVLGKGAKVAAGEKVFINFARINEPDDIKQILDKMAQTFAPSIKEAQRGVRSHEATKKAADALGMSVDDVLARRQGQLFNSEESLAARRIWAASARKLKEVTQKAIAPNAGTVDQYIFRKMLAVHFAIQGEVIGARTEIARALNAMKIPVEGGGIELARGIQTVIESMGGPKVTRALAEAIAKLGEGDATSAAALNAAVRRGVVARTLDAVKEMYVLGLLWIPKTHFVNMQSNTLVLIQQIYERAAAARIGTMLGHDIGEGVAKGEALGMAWSVVANLRNALRLSARAFRTGQTGFGLQKIDLPRKRAISAEELGFSQATGFGRAVDFIGNANRLPGNLLSGADEFFKTIGYGAEIYAQAVRQTAGEGKKSIVEFATRLAELVSNPTQGARLASVNAATYSTFTDGVSALGKALFKLRQVDPMFVALPFVRTPDRILNYTGERTLFAFLIARWRADIRAGGARREIALARIATGSAIMAIAYDLAYAGMITGAGPSDRGDRDTLFRTGWQPESVRVGDKYYSYSRTDPLGVLMGFAASMAEMVRRFEVDEDDFDGITGIVAETIQAVSAVIVSKTYFQGLQNIFEVISDPEQFSASYINRTVATFLPATTLFSFVKSAVDPIMRDFNTAGEAIMARIAGLSEMLPARRDLWGRPIKAEEVYGRVYDILSPIRVRQAKETPIDEEMLRLSVGIPRIRKKTSLLGVDINFRDFPKAYDVYVRLAGNDLKHPAWGVGTMDFLNAVVSGEHPMSAVYRIKSDGEEGDKAAFIRSTVTEYRRLAAQAILDDPRFPELRELWERKQREKQERRLPVLQ